MWARAPRERRSKYSSVTFDWHVLLGWNGLISTWLAQSSWGGKLHLSSIPRPHSGSLTHLSLNWQSLSDGVSSRGEGGFHFRNAWNSLTRCPSRALKTLGSRGHWCVHKWNPQRVWGSFLIISRRKWLLAELPSVYFPAPDSFFYISSVIDGAFFLLLYLAPNLAKVTGPTWADPKRGLGTAVDKLKQSSGMVVTHQMNRSIVFHWASQELITAALNAALFPLLSFGGLKQYLCDSFRCDDAQVMGKWSNQALFLHYPDP